MWPPCIHTLHAEQAGTSFSARVQLYMCLVCRPSAGWSAPLTLTATVQMLYGAWAMPTPPRWACVL